MEGVVVHCVAKAWNFSLVLLQTVMFISEPHEVVSVGKLLLASVLNPSTHWAKAGLDIQYRDKQRHTQTFANWVCQCFCKPGPVSKIMSSIKSIHLDPHDYNGEMWQKVNDLRSNPNCFYIWNQTVRSSCSVVLPPPASIFDLTTNLSVPAEPRLSRYGNMQPRLCGGDCTQTHEW